MTAYNFVFSEERKIKIGRHLSFWAMVCLLTFYSGLSPVNFGDLLNLNPYKQSLISLICFMPLRVFSVYSFTCLLIPGYLQRKRYPAFVIAALIVALCNFLSGIFLSNLFFKILGWHFTDTDKSFAPFRTSVYQGIILAFFSTGGIATAIKLIKNWYGQQIENTKLIKLKSEKDIKLLKAHIHPAFLFQTLNIVHKKIVSCENDAPEMVLQLSELLSHLLYDDNDELIPIQKELEILYLLIDLIKMDKERNLITNIIIEGNLGGKYIYPLLMFSYLQDGLISAKKNKDDDKTVKIVLNIQDKIVIFRATGCIELNTQFPIYHNPDLSRTFENNITGIYT